MGGGIGKGDNFRPLSLQLACKVYILFFVYKCGGQCQLSSSIALYLLKPGLYLEQWFSAFLVPQLFNTVPGVVSTLNHEIILIATS